jgi:hypothetical protein
MENAELIALINRFLLEKKKHKMPFHLNVIDELHANENAHSRILIKLLQYQSKDKKYPILVSFMFMLSSHCPQFSHQHQIEKPHISGQEDHIDALIEEKGKYAIIIENKIHWAPDQRQQLDRYIDSIKEHGFKKTDRNVYVVYLTRDGNKIVNEKSFSKAKTFLEYKDEKDPGRYITLNYKDDILPWLKKEVLPSCEEDNPILLSALKQYVDHLDGMFNLRKEEQMINNSIIDSLLGERKDDIDYVDNYINDLDDLRSLLQNRLDELKIKNITEEYVKPIQKCIGKKHNLDSYVWDGGTGFTFFSNSHWHTQNKKDLRSYFEIDLQNNSFSYGIGFENQHYSYFEEAKAPRSKARRYYKAFKTCFEKEKDNIREEIGSGWWLVINDEIHSTGNALVKRIVSIINKQLAAMD